jgi:type VI secretion system protein ImpA
MDFDALLGPIAGPSPTGEDLSFSPEFDQIAEWRRQDDPTLDQGEWLTTLKVADWPRVTQRCADLLAGRSKDLRLAMWLMESSALVRGYEGLREGLSLCTSLCERYWTGLHPLPDGSDMEERIGNLAWLLQRVVALSDACPVTQGQQGRLASCSLRDLAAARQRQGQAPGQHDRQQDGDELTLEQFNRALQQTPRPFLRSQLDALRGSHVQVVALQAVVDTQLGHSGPSFVAAKEALQAALHELERLAREVGALDDGQVLPGEHVLAAAHLGGTTPVRYPGPAAGPVSSRAQALQQLREVAAFFRRTEPHSPVAYLADKAVSWGEMPLHEWLRQVVKDPASVSQLDELLGVPARPQS